MHYSFDFIVLEDNIIRRESGAENNYTANQTYIDIQKSGALPFPMHAKLTLLFKGEPCM